MLALNSLVEFVYLSDLLVGEKFSIVGINLNIFMMSIFCWIREATWDHYLSMRRFFFKEYMRRFFMKESILVVRM
jgi:hypothetical protein